GFGSRAAAGTPSAIDRTAPGTLYIDQWTNGAPLATSGSSISTTKLAVPSGTASQASAGETFVPSAACSSGMRPLLRNAGDVTDRTRAPRPTRACANSAGVAAGGRGASAPVIPIRAP